VNDPYKAFSELLHLYEEKTSKPTGKAASSSIHASVNLEAEIYIGANVIIENDATLKKGVSIHANSFIGKNVTIGENTIIHPNVIIYSNTIIGAHCVIHSGSVLGADGFGFAPQKDGSYQKVPQTGNVIVGDYVEIGANTTIDRATIGSTQIGDGVKLDNQVQIAHNVQIGKHTVIAAQSGIAGSSQVGDYCVIGGQVGIIGHLKIGNHVRIQGQSGVIKNIPDNTDIQGSPAMGYRDFYRSYAVFKRLPEIEKKISQSKKD
jgi:UDP-3-O-[3-hydroxymyristoyl] glucosamine N-acyltransferase